MPRLTRPAAAKPAPAARTRISTQPRQLITQPRQIIHRTIQRGVLRRWLRFAHRAGRIAHLLTQLVQIVRDRRLHGIGKISASQPVRTLLQPGSQIVLIHAIERRAQFRRSSRLRGSQFARSGPKLLREARKIVGHLLAVVNQLVDFLRRRALWLLTGRLRRILLRHQAAYIIRLLFLPLSQLLRRLGH